MPETKKKTLHDITAEDIKNIVEQYPYNSNKTIATNLKISDQTLAKILSAIKKAKPDALGEKRRGSKLDAAIKEWIMIDGQD